MSLIPPTDLPYGSLEMEEIYFQHDGPRFFALKSSRWGMRLLGFCVAEDEENEQVTYIYLVLTLSRFYQVRSGAMSLLDAFNKAEEGDIWEVIADYRLEPPANRTRQVTAVKSEWLPTEDAFLNLPTPSVLEFDPNQFVRDSIEMQRSLIAIELDPEQSRLTELSLRSLGHFSTYFQDVIDAIAQEEQGERTASGPVAGKISSEVQVSALGVMAASFVLIVGVDRGVRLLENRELVSKTFGRLTSLVNSATNSGELISQLKEYGPRTRRGLRLILHSASVIGSGLKVHSAPIEGQSSIASLSRTQVESALGYIASVKPTLSEVTLNRVALTALNTSYHTFEVRNMLQGSKFSGHIAPEARIQTNGLRVGDATLYSVKIGIETDFASTEDQPLEKYKLLDIKTTVE